MLLARCTLTCTYVEQKNQLCVNFVVVVYVLGCRKYDRCQGSRIFIDRMALHPRIAELHKAFRVKHSGKSAILLLLLTRVSIHDDHSKGERGEMKRQKTF